MNLRCESCQREIPEYASFCPICGKKVTRMNDSSSSETSFFQTVSHISSHWQYISPSIQLTINLLCFFAIFYLLGVIIALVSMDNILFIDSMIFLLLSSVSIYYLFKMNRKGVFFGYVFSVISLFIYLPEIFTNNDDVQGRALYIAFNVFYFAIMVLLFFGRQLMNDE